MGSVPTTFALYSLPSFGLDHDFVGVLDDVVVGDDIAVIGDEEARALSHAAAARASELEGLTTEAAPLELLEELTERAVPAAGLAWRIGGRCRCPRHRRRHP